MCEDTLVEAEEASEQPIGASAHPRSASADPLLEIAARLESLGLTDDARTLRELATEVEAIRQHGAAIRAGKVPVSVAVIGAFNSGKSSFINRLLGEEVCPVDACPTTSSITRFRFGERRRIECLNADGPTEVSEDDFRSAVRHPINGDGRASENVARFVFHAPFPLLRDVDLIDTPGFENPQNQLDEKITLKEMPQADVIFYVMDINQSTITHSGLDVLERIRRETPELRFYLVVNKAEQKSVAGRARVLSDLQRTYRGLFMEVFLFSAKKPGHEGTARVEDFIARFQEIERDKVTIAGLRHRHKERQLVARLLDRLSQVRRGVRRCLDRDASAVERLRERLRQWLSMKNRGEKAIRNACREFVHDEVRSAFSVEEIEDSGWFQNDARIVWHESMLLEHLRASGVVEEAVRAMERLCDLADSTRPVKRFRHRLEQAWAAATSEFLESLADDCNARILPRYWSVTEAESALEEYIGNIGDGGHLWGPMVGPLLRTFAEIADEVRSGMEADQWKAQESCTASTRTIEILDRLAGSFG